MTEARDISADFKGGFIKTQGIAKLNRAMLAAGQDAEDNRELMFKLGTIVADEAKQIAPQRSGKLVGAIRAGRGKTKAVVRAGFKSVPYAPVIHYGWQEHGIEAQPYLLQALQNKRAEVIRVFELGIGQLTEKHFGTNTTLISGD